MTDKQIIIKDYFNILRDEYGRIYCIQDVGDPKSLIKAIRKQNEYIQAKEQECEKKSRAIGNLGYKIKNQRKEINVRLEQLDQLKAGNENLKQTIAEIKEIADKDFRHTAWEEYAKQLKQILQKISECEVENGFRY